MKKPTSELVDAFLAWFRDDPHSTQEDHYAGTVTQEYLSHIGRDEFIEFFYQFACDGGYVQSGGHRTASRFRATIALNRLEIPIGVHSRAFAVQYRQIEAEDLR